MKAIILAAGMGSRLKELTKENPKCMIEIDGETLIKKLLFQLDKNSLEEIIVVLGYKKEVLRNYINQLKLKTPIKFIDNKVYDTTNNIYSLYLAREEMKNNDILLIESDLIFDDKILEKILKNNEENVAVVAPFELWMDGTCVKIDDKSNITDFVSSKSLDFDGRKDYYKTVNIYKFSKEFNKKYYIPFLEAYISARGKNEYYETALEVILNVVPNKLKALVLSNEKWYEIDDKQDLNIAETIFGDLGDRLKKIQNRYGGYWRYPKLKDFCYLVNPYFPPQKMVEELKMNFNELLTQYPSGLKVNSFLAAKYFNIDEKNIIVGNGAAELIKVLIENISGNIGIIRPTFEEYTNRIINENFTVFYPHNLGFKYNEEDIIKYFKDKKLEYLLLINPDNPSGNYINKKGILKLLEWTKQENIKFIVDESFVDFAKEEGATLLKREILQNFSNLIVVKSISKSYGVPGLRLGVIATKDIQMLEKLKKKVSIWNINSFGEFYMQIYGKYEKYYFESLKK